MSHPTPTPETTAASRFRTTLVRVLLVQAISLVALGLVQLFYNR